MKLPTDNICPLFRHVYQVSARPRGEFYGINHTFLLDVKHGQQNRKYRSSQDAPVLRYPQHG